MFMYTLFAILLSCSSSKNLDTAISEITPPFEVESPKELVLIPEKPQDMSISKDGSFLSLLRQETTYIDSKKQSMR